jgi:hypothetical protein
MLSSPEKKLTAVKNNKDNHRGTEDTEKGLSS